MEKKGATTRESPISPSSADVLETLYSERPPAKVRHKQTSPEMRSEHPAASTSAAQQASALSIPPIPSHTLHPEFHRHLSRTELQPLFLMTEEA